MRATAFLVDVVIRGFSLTVLLGLLGRTGRFGVAPMLILLFVINWLYPVIFELLPAAATPGKHIMGLQVMMASGLPITPAGCLIRNLMRFVDLLPLLYACAIVTVLLRRDARRLGDLAGGTVVAYRHEPAPAGALASITPLPPRRSLSARQQAAIAAFAWRAERLTPERAEEIAELAGPVVAPGLATEAMTTRLIGIARWLQGQRPAGKTSVTAPAALKASGS